MIIGCKTCPSPDCSGCNVFILKEMLENGDLDWALDEHHSIDPVLIGLAWTPTIKEGEDNES